MKRWPEMDHAMNLMSQLEHAEFIVLRFELRFLEAIDVDMAMLLRLRRSLRAAGQYALYAASSGQDGQTNRFGALFSPPLADDPVARRRFQRSGAAFVLQPTTEMCRTYQRGEYMSLSVVLWGGQQQQIGDFALVLKALGQSGLRYDAGKFELAAIHGEDSSGHYSLLWRSGQPLQTLVAPLRDANWWLNSTLPPSDKIQLRFITPARLMNRQRPLFQADFTRLFPFILRRVSSMLYSYSYLEVVSDAGQLLDAAAQVVVENQLRWQDWRSLGPNPEQQQPLGGVMGKICVQGPAVQDILPFLALGSLMNLGKNAAYGAGHYVLEEWSDDDRNHGE
ncbi:MAG: CRISPR system precrRNA processing endoribonuclease RAMP protein Cas6 [Desulfuromonas sp.]|nr:CRISPR system precrRNA processing endoribonuclease RAMP protein Cas6 [Desulfuromonas sp.]